MNKIYKVIWNKTRGMYMVVSELARNQSRGGGSVDKRRKLTQAAAALALFFSIFSAGGTALAADPLTIGTAEVADTGGRVVNVLTGNSGEASAINDALKQVETNRDAIDANKDAIKTNKEAIDANGRNITANRDAITTLETNVNDADAAEKKARINADKKLAEAVNSGLSLSDDNVLQKSSAAVNNDDGSVTTSKSDASEVILNKGNDNQITMNTNGLKVGTNSSVMDEGGFYTGGDTYSEAKAAMKADGSIKGADGKFTVNSANGSVNVNDEIRLDGATGKVSAKGLDINNKMNVDSDGNIGTDGNISAKGTLGAADGKFNVDTNGGVTAAGGNMTVNSDGKIDTKGSISADGNISVKGTLGAAGGKFNVDSDGKIKSSGLDAGSGTIQTTGMVKAGDVKTGTLETTGDAAIGGNLTVTGKLNVDEINMTKNGIVDDNNVIASTKVAAGEIKGYKKATSTRDGSEKESAINYDENGTSTWAKATDAASNWSKSTLSVEGNGVTTKVLDSEKNSNTTSKTAGQSENTIGDGTTTNQSTFRQKINQILQEIKSNNGSTSVEQTDVNITNTAQNGTITNDAKNLVNNASGNMTNTVGGDLITTVSGNKTESVTGDVNESYGSLTTSVTNDSSLTAENITNTARNKITNKALDVETDASSSIVNRVSNAYGTNTSTQTAGQTVEEMSQADGKKASYTRGAGEQKSQLTDGSKKTTIDTIAGQTNTNITDGDNISNSLQKADQVASSVKNGTNITVVNQDVRSLASSITDGTRFNNTSSTVDSSERLIKASDTQYSDSKQTASKMEDVLVRGSSIIDVIRNLDDAANPVIKSTVTDGTNSTSVSQTAKDITNTAQDGTITNDAREIVNKAAISIKDMVGKTTVTTTDDRTTFENTDHADRIGEGSITSTTISGNTVITGKVTTDYATVNNDLTVNGKSTFKDDVTMEKNLEVKGTTTTDKLVVKNGATISGGTTTDTLHVTGKSTFDGMVSFKEAVSIEKDLSVGGNATVTGDVSAKSYKVAGKTYIDQNGINANSQKVTNVADGDVSEGSKDAVNGGQLYHTNQRVSTVENRMDGVENRVGRVENRVDNLDSRIDKVGASAAAMANLHPMDFDEDSKVSVAAAAGNYRSETAGALGVFYRPTDRVMLNVSTSFGNGENMVGGGVTFKLGKSSKRLQQAEATNEALSKQVTNLQNRLDALLGVLNPNLSKAFPDVPANHWAYEAVSRLAGNDIIKGYEDGKYHGDRTMTRYEMAEIIYNALSQGAKSEVRLVEEFRPELQAMAAQRKA